MLCVTNWNAVLELRTDPYTLVKGYKDRCRREIIIKQFNKLLNIADPDAIDAGMILHIDEIKLVARIKR